MNIKAIIDNKKFIPDHLKDQFFLIDNSVVDDLVNFAEVDKNDVVLEIGAGFGNLTREIAKRAKKVIVFEIDKKFKPFLKDLPENVELHFEDAWDYVKLHGKFNKKKTYNKVVSNLPYSFCEKFLHNLTFLEYDKVVLLVPLKFVNKIKENSIFNSFFVCDLKEIVAKDKFYPIPRTNSAVIDLLKIEDPLKEKKLALFLRQYIYQHEGQKVKNSIREGLIVFAQKAHGKSLTKNEARKLIVGAELKESLLDETPKSDEVYAKISDKFIQNLI